MCTAPSYTYCGSPLRLPRHLFIHPPAHISPIFSHPFSPSLPTSHTSPFSYYTRTLCHLRWHISHLSLTLRISIRNNLFISQILSIYLYQCLFSPHLEFLSLLISPSYIISSSPSILPAFCIHLFSQRLPISVSYLSHLIVSLSRTLCSASFNTLSLSCITYLSPYQ